MNWSKYQLNFFEAIKSIPDNIVVSATAGSGKSTVLVEAAKIIASGKEYSKNRTQKAIFLAFNKSIQLELEKRLPNNFEAKTLNSFGFSFLRQINKWWKVDPKKYLTLSKAIVSHVYRSSDNNEQYKIALMLTKAVDMVRNTNVDISDSDSFWQMVFEYGLDDITDYDIPLIKSILIAGEWLASDRNQSIDDNYARLIVQDVKGSTPKRFIDFTDQIWLSIKWGLVKPEYDIMLIDEAQDLNALQLELVLLALNHSGRGIWVGDSSQSIYGFSGADHNSIQKIIERTDAKVMPLSITYRCPVSHVALASSIDPSIEPAPNAKDGIVKSIDSELLVDELLPHYQSREKTLLISRVNAPLVKYAFMLLGNRIPAKIKGRDIGTNIINTIKKVSGKKSSLFDNFLVDVQDWYVKEYDKMKKKKAKESQLQSLTDKYETILALYDGIDPTSMEHFCREIEGMFTEENGVITLATVHKVKGLEAENVFILVPDKLPLIWKNQTENELIQEMNIKFVALTRSKDKLVFVNEPEEY